MLPRYNAPNLIGQTLSHFKITAKLGGGGMGEVYRAEDTKLGREVAIKVLPEALTADAERLARFEREAKVLASLNHPNVAGIYQIEEVDGRQLLVMELVEGEDLAERIARGPVPVDDAIHIARQVAEGLEAAHERGIVHRDLKPANVKVTPEGQVKVLDFGLAHARSEHQDRGSDLSLSPTLTAHMTEAGMILGTAAYMSPEQARGKRVDKRTDIWAFGVLLYEMLSSRRGYEGETVTDLIAAIVTRDPDWEQLPDGLPPRLRALIEHCLVKDPLDRLRDIGDARIELDRIDEEPAVQATGAPAVGSDRRLRGMLPWVLAALTFVVAVVALTRRSPDTVPRAGSAQHLSIVLPERQDVAQYSTIALSPSGAEVVYPATEDGVTRLYRRPLDAAEPLPIAGSEGARHPFFSPAGDAVGFDGDETLRVVPLAGGGARKLCDCPVTYGGTWSADGTIVFTPRWNTGLWAVPAESTGAEPRVVTELDSERGDVTHVFPQALPDGERVLFTIWTADGPRGAVASIDTGEVSVVHEGGVAYRYAASGHLLFGQGDTLQAVAFDLETLVPTGQPQQLATGVYTRPVDGFSAFNVSPGGLLAYRPAGQGGMRQLIWSDRQGNTRPALDIVDQFAQIALSPDGSRVAFQYPAPGGPLQTAVVDLAGGLRTQLTNSGDNVRPVFMPAGDSVVFSRSGSTGYELLRAPIDGSSAPEPLPTGGVELTHVRANSFSSDGRYLTYDVRHPITGFEMYVLDLEGEDPPRNLLSSPQGQSLTAMISPDDRWIVYVSNATGRNELYLMPFNGSGGSSQITSDGGYAPRWNPTGNGEIFFANDHQLMSVVLDTSGAPRIVQPPTVLFECPGLTPTPENHWYDVAPDGESFLFVEEIAPGPEANQIHLVLSVFDELVGP